MFDLEIRVFNNIYNENCLSTMYSMEDEYVDLVVTSPPYDGLREYNGYDFQFEKIAQQLFRILKTGGVIVWVVGDEVINGSESGTSFTQALFFKSIGFNIHDTMIYEKNSVAFQSKEGDSRYTNIFEYMFVFSKGKPKTVNLIKDKKNKHAGKTASSLGNEFVVKNFSARTNIWKYATSSNDKTGHPAVFPELLAHDNIITWSNEGDVIYDPFSGSGTTCKVARLLKRKWIGSEISEEYYKISLKRVEEKGSLGLFE